MISTEGSFQLGDDVVWHAVNDTCVQSQAVDHRLGGRFEDFEAIEGVKDSRPEDLNAVVFEDKDGRFQRGTAGDLASVGEPIGVRDAGDVAEEDVAFGDRPGFERGVGHGEGGGVDRVGVDDRVDLRVGVVDGLVVPAGTAGGLALLGAATADENDVGRLEVVAVGPVGGDRGTNRGRGGRRRRPPC